MDKHDLHHEFPEYDSIITELKTSNTHFKKLFDDYNKINKSIHRLETSEKYTDDELNALRIKNSTKLPPIPRINNNTNSCIVGIIQL